MYGAREYRDHKARSKYLLEQHKDKQMRLAWAQHGYEAACRAAQAEPNNPQRRVSALGAGRHLASTQRWCAYGDSATTAVDEMAIMNDLNARLGPPGQTPDRVAQFERLAQLRASGALSEAEFLAEKAKLLNS